MRAQVGGGDLGGVGHEAVEHERHVVTAAAVAARGLAERGARELDVGAVDRVAERRERMRAGPPLRRGVGVTGRAAVDVGQHRAVADVGRIARPVRAVPCDRDQARRVLPGRARQTHGDGWPRRHRCALAPRALAAARRPCEHRPQRPCARDHPTATRAIPTRAIRDEHRPMHLVAPQRGPRRRRARRTLATTRPRAARSAPEVPEAAQPQPERPFDVRSASAAD